MKKYFSVYRRLCIANWNVLMAYRADVFMQIVSSLAFSVNHVFIILLLTVKVPSVYGWSRGELLLLAGVYNMFIGIYHAFISRNLNHIADEIYFGRLDYVLLKPIDSQLSTTIWKINYASLIRFVFGAGLSFYLLHDMSVSLTVSSVVLFFLFILLGMFLLYSFWLPFISLIIFNPRLSNIIMLLYQLTNVSRYPKEMYARLPVYMVAVLLPLTLIITMPTKVLVQKFSYSLASELVIVCLVMGLFARFTWKFALRHYTSASS